MLRLVKEFDDELGQHYYVEVNVNNVGVTIKVNEVKHTFHPEVAIVLLLLLLDSYGEIQNNKLQRRNFRL